MNQAQSQYLGNILASEIVNFKALENAASSTWDDKFASLNTIIELKKLINHSGDNSIYLDLKYFFKLYLKAIEEKDNNYDDISINMIERKVSSLSDIEKIKLLKIFKRELLLNHYVEYIDECNRCILKAELKHYCSKFTFRHLLKIVAIWSSASIRNLFISLIIFFAFSSLFFLPAPCNELTTFNLEYRSFCSGSVFNFILNILSLFFDIESGLKVTPINGIGVLQMILGKVIYLSILINFFIKKLTDLLKIID
jgi:hypothetical protein